MDDALDLYEDGHTEPIGRINSSGYLERIDDRRLPKILFGAVPVMIFVSYGYFAILAPLESASPYTGPDQ